MAQAADDPTGAECISDPVRFGLFDLSRLPIDWGAVSEDDLLEGLMNTRALQKRELELRRKLKTLQLQAGKSKQIIIPDTVVNADPFNDDDLRARAQGAR